MSRLWCFYEKEQVRPESGASHFIDPYRQLRSELECLDVLSAVSYEYVMCEVYRIDDSALMEEKKKDLKLVL